MRINRITHSNKMGEFIMDVSYKSIIERLIKSLETKDSKFIDPVEKCIDISAKAIMNNNCIFVCGNGGSAATSSHIANDLLCHMKNWKRDPYKIMSLTDNVSTITSLTNDYGFEKVFAKQLEAFGKKGDVIWAFSTSGNSKNCVIALEKAKEMEIITVGITGREGGKMKDISDIWLPVDSDEVTRVEELHMIIAHILGENIEAKVSPTN